MSSRFTRRLIYVILAVCILIIALMITRPSLLPGPLPLPSATPASPAEYLSDVLNIIQEHALYSNHISDWSAFRKQALAMIVNVRTTADTYSTIRYTLRHLNDNHSQFWPHDQASQFSAHTGTGIFGSYVPPVVQRLSGKLGYIQLPQVITESDFDPYVKAVYAGLKQLSEPPVCGWVVDLRHDQGGNMYPMLVALGPLLGNGEFGAFIDKNHVQSRWFYRDGAAGIGDKIAYQYTPPDLAIDYSMAPVAVLTGPSTASAGEALVISFSGRKQTQRFGASTYGATTANRTYLLSDGAALLLAETYEADRDGSIVVGRISPDIPITNGTTSSDLVLKAATDWLNGLCPA